MVLAKAVEKGTLNRAPNVFCCRIKVALGWPMKRKGQRKQRQSDEQEISESLIISLEYASIVVLPKDTKNTNSRIQRSPEPHRCVLFSIDLHRPERSHFSGGSGSVVCVHTDFLNILCIAPYLMRSDLSQINAKVYLLS